MLHPGTAVGYHARWNGSRPCWRAKHLEDILVFDTAGVYQMLRPYMVLVFPLRITKPV